jgi:hypothetical protein
MSEELVGTKTVDSTDSLRSLLVKRASGKCWYFACWPHDVSGMTEAIDDVLPSPEGQMFSKEFEMRWKQNIHQGFEVLLLHRKQSVKEWEFTPVGGNWEISDPLDAHFYDPRETRFPHEFKLAGKTNFQQIYFRDKATATVHFVALMLAK